VRDGRGEGRLGGVADAGEADPGEAAESRSTAPPGEKARL
jgi:hypothetical protein